MLLKLLFFRLAPMFALRFCKTGNQMKLAVCVTIGLYLSGLILLLRKLIFDGSWDVLLWIPAALFPHYLFYGFAVWMLLRCLFYAWSERVFKRIYRVAFVVILLGVMAETFLNPHILRFFCKNFK